MIKSRLIIALLLSGLAVGSLPATAGPMTLHVGPASVGNGGPNPVSIPPTTITDYELVYVTDGGSEWSLAITPGLFYGFRSTNKSGPYFGLGGGLVLSANGVGPGIYSSFGINTFCGWVCFNLEFKQALGIAAGGLVSPYALRAGVTFDW